MAIFLEQNQQFAYRQLRSENWPTECTVLVLSKVAVKYGIFYILWRGQSAKQLFYSVTVNEIYYGTYHLRVNQNLREDSVLYKCMSMLISERDQSLCGLYN